MSLVEIESIDEKRMYINPNLVKWIWADKDSVYITFLSRDSLTVKGSLTEVKEKLSAKMTHSPVNHV